MRSCAGGIFSEKFSVFQPVAQDAQRQQASPAAAPTDHQAGIPAPMHTGGAGSRPGPGRRPRPADHPRPAPADHTGAHIHTRQQARPEDHQPRHHSRRTAGHTASTGSRPAHHRPSSHTQQPPATNYTKRPRFNTNAPAPTTQRPRAREILNAPARRYWRARARPLRVQRRKIFLGTGSKNRFPGSGRKNRKGGQNATKMPRNCTAGSPRQEKGGIIFERTLILRQYAI